jgi:DNA-directed RNA polymerase subunit RPC12/RpoP
MIHFGCPTCGKIFQVKDKYAGKRTKCPKCGQAIQLLQPSSPVHSAAEGQSSVIRPFYRPPQRHTSQAGLFIGCAAVFLLVFGIILVTLWNNGVFLSHSEDISFDDFFYANLWDGMGDSSIVKEEGPKGLEVIARMSDGEFRTYTRRRAISLRQKAKSFEILSGEARGNFEKAAEIYEAIARYGLSREGEKKRLAIGR